MHIIAALFTLAALTGYATAGLAYVQAADRAPRYSAKRHGRRAAYPFFYVATVAAFFPPIALALHMP